MVPSPARRRWRWFVFFVVVDLVDFALSYHAHLTYVAGPNMPTIMPVGQLLGWATSVLLLIALLVTAFASLRTRRLPSYRQVRIQPPRE